MIRSAATLLVFAAVALPAAAQDVRSRTQFDADSGPVTVNSVQPPIPNASDYATPFATLDTNGDGRISKAEVPANHALSFEFKLVDTNRNGWISEEELAGWK